jgi:3'-phosphoadenosine 5'-phosphosulfate sulfotransferase (PAPS reductase)/FAD synthetase
MSGEAFFSWPDPVLQAQGFLDAAIEEHRPTHIFALFSGGHDSLCSTHLAMAHIPKATVLTLHTGVGIKATRRFSYETAKQFSWPYRVYRPQHGNRYHQMVEEYGFPGKAQHRVAYIRLKERQLERVVREHKTDRKDRIMFVTGVRKSESQKRMGYVQPVFREGATVWVAPICEWENSHKDDYMEANGLPRNEVVDLLCMSGECLCGAFGSPAELEEIRLWFPDDAAKIDCLREKMRDRWSWSWGEHPPPKSFEGADSTQGELHLCASCEAKKEAA